jgi:hypothetical protein
MLAFRGTCQLLACANVNLSDENKFDTDAARRGGIFCISLLVSSALLFRFFFFLFAICLSLFRFFTSSYR